MGGKAGMVQVFIAPDPPLKPHYHSPFILLMTLEPMRISPDIFFSNL